MVLVKGWFSTLTLLEHGWNLRIRQSKISERAWRIFYLA
jgi:hypothetical protein